ncbi:MAG: DUF4274 domain-containing protein [Chloroflexota bacterium]
MNTQKIDEEKAMALFLKASGHNWDLGYQPIRRILNNPDCDLGTLLMVYWNASPEYYLAFNTINEVPTVNQEGWSFIKDVEARFLSGNYPALIQYDPTSDTGHYDNQKADWVRQLPAEMYETTPGTIRSEDLFAGLYGPGALNAAAKANNVRRLAELLEEGNDVNFKNLGYTPLMSAAEAHAFEAVQFLIEKNANPNLKGQDGKAPLHLAFRVKIAHYLLENGAKIDLKSKWWGSAVHFVAQDIWYRSEEGLLDLLLKYSPKPTITDHRGATALHLAAERGKVANFKKLLKAGWHLNALDEEGRNVLHYAVDFPGWNHVDDINRGPMVEEILRLGISPDDADAKGKSARDVAAYNPDSYLGPLERDQILKLLDLD